MRPNPPSPSGEVIRKTDAELGLVTQTRKYQLITPLFGGGAEAGKNDLTMPINGKSIRGQLRFWWRAMRAKDQHIDEILLNQSLPMYYLDKNNKPLLDENGNPKPLSQIAKLRQLEGTIWGLASGDSGKPSSVQIGVRIGNYGESIEVKAWWEWNANTNKWQWKSDVDTHFPSYAAFPLRPEEDKGKPPNLGTKPKQKLNERTTASLLKNTTFNVEIAYPQIFAREIEAALWAWENFGGVGARTRRGFGAFELSSTLQTENLQAQFDSHQAQGQHLDGIPYISNFAISQTDWKNRIQRYQNFRQGGGFARTPESGRNTGSPGRSYWTEPDAIRHLTQQSLISHQDLMITPLIDAFPRGQLGMPIIFHFKDSSKNNPFNPNVDPRETTLQPSHHDRLASPLLIRPMNATQTIIALLKVNRQSELLGDVELSGENFNQVVNIEFAAADDVSTIKPLAAYHTRDILEAAFQHLTT